MSSCRFQGRGACAFFGSTTDANGGMTMRILFSVLLILVLVQTTVSVSEEPHDFTVTTLMTSVLVEIQPGKENGRHMHAVPTYVHVLEGTMTVEFEDGARQTFNAGSGFLEVVNTVHSAKNLGEVPLRLLVVFVGEEGKPNLIRPAKHQAPDATK
jgi:quercetin dioxygenase-like cupin family protein